jgi:hypothetical protein
MPLNNVKAKDEKMTDRMSTTFFILFLLGALFFEVVCSQAAVTIAKSEAEVAVLDWFKMNPAQFGCYLQKTFGVRDRKWNCNLRKPIATGDPCENTKSYYAGPEFPQQLVKKINPRLDGVHLAWEHGKQQAVALLFTSKVAEAEARAMFGLPQTGVPPNLMSVDHQDCSPNSTCLLIQMFDHMGAGEVDCSDK